MNTSKKNNNKKWIGLIIGLVCFAVVLILLLTMCNGRGDSDEPTNPSQTADSTENTTVATEEAAPTEETTEPPTEETEPTTEETEPAGSSRPGGSSTPGGTGGGPSSGGTTTPTEEPTEPSEPTEPPVEVSGPGTQTNAYTEVVEKFPGEFTTVVIPAKETVYYNVYTTGAILTIEDADAVVVLGEKTYKPDEGVISIDLPASTGEAPICVQIANKGTAEKPFTVRILESLGSESNPIVLETLDEIKASLAAGDKDGIFYAWTADTNGTVQLEIESITPATAAADVIVTVGKQTYKLSENTENVLSFNVEEEDEVLVQIVAKPDAAGEYPAAEVTVKSKTALPTDLYVDMTVGTADTGVIPAGKTAYYNLYGVTGTILTIHDPEVSVIYDGQTYQPDENGVITVKLAPGNPRIPAALQITNEGAAEKPVTMYFVYPVGAYANPEVLTQLGDLDVTIEANTDGYYYTYTATEDALVEFKIWERPEQETVKTDIILTNNTTSVQSSLWTYDEVNSVDVEKPTVSVFASKGDEITILVSVTDPELYTCVDAELAISGALSGTVGNPITVLDDSTDESDTTVTMTTVEVPANIQMYYAIPKISEGILTVTGAGSFTVNYEDVAYSSADGAATIPNVSAVSTNEPAIISIVGDADGAYNLLITFPEGHQMNPVPLTLNGVEANVAEIEKNDEDGFFFAWKATEDGNLQIIMQDPDDTNWQGYIYNQTTGQQLDVVTSTAVKEETATKVLVMEVSKDDEIEVCVNTYNEENPNRYIAGTVKFSAFLHGTADDPILLEKGSGTDTTISLTTAEFPLDTPIYYAIPDAENVTLVVTNTERGRFSVGYGETVKNSSSARAGTSLTIEGITSDGEDKVQVFYISGRADNSYEITVTYPQEQQTALDQPEQQTIDPVEDQDAALPPEEEELIPSPSEETQSAAEDEPQPETEGQTSSDAPTEEPQA